jgi:hypothetical protein
MAAIITDDFRRNAAQLLVSDVTTGGSNYYVGVGKSDAYDPDSAGLAETDGSFSLPVPAASRAEELEVLNNLATLSKVGTNSAFRVMPRVYYQASKRYKVYDPNDANCFFAETIDGNEYEPCYVINTDLEVFICLKNDGTTTSNNDDVPTMTATLNDIFGASESRKNNGLITTADDDFRWAYVCTLNRDSGFFTTQFAAIGNSGSSAVDNPALTAYSGSNHPSETSGGLIYGFKVIDGGAGYSAGDLTVNCTGLKTDGTGGDNTDLVQFNQSITCTITVDGSGTITQCVTKLSSSQINTTNILGVVSANAVAASGAAILEPMILPLEGVGTNNLKLLPSYYCGIRANFEDDLGGDGLIIPFRQVSLLKDPSLSSGDTPSATSSYAAGDAAKGLRYVACSASLPADLATGDILFDAVGNGTNSTVQDAITNEDPIAIFDHLDTTNNRLYYHQNFDDDDSQNLLELNTGGDTLKWYDKSAGAVSSNTIAYTGDPQYPEFTIVDYTNANTSSGTEKFGQLNGDVLFIENRSSVTRATDQIEEVRMIIQF